MNPSHIHSQVFLCSKNLMGVNKLFTILFAIFAFFSDIYFEHLAKQPDYSAFRPNVIIPSAPPEMDHRVEVDMDHTTDQYPAFSECETEMSSRCTEPLNG